MNHENGTVEQSLYPHCNMGLGHCMQPFLRAFATLGCCLAHTASHLSFPRGHLQRCMYESSCRLLTAAGLLHSLLRHAFKLCSAEAWAQEPKNALYTLVVSSTW